MDSANATNASLGNNTKCSPSKNDSSPVATLSGSEKKQAKNSQAQRFLRYALQDVARNLMLSQVDDGLEGLEALNSAHRICKCRRTRVSETVDIYKSIEHKKAHYGGLAICGSVWGCPVCASKIQEQRREEISQAVDWAYENGYTVTMVTLTFPHYNFQSCQELLDKQKAAFKLMRQGGDWTRFKKQYSFEGLIRSLEVNKGANGWHPHTHELWIHKPGNQQKFARAVHKKYREACKKVGLIPRGKMQAFDKYATKCDFNVSNSDYLAKIDDSKHWGIDREMSKSSVKKSFKGLPPFGLLFRFAQGDEQYGPMFIEYLKAFHGKRQIFWSQRLKKKVGLQERTDSDLAESKDDDAEIIIKLEMFGWRQVCKENARSEILDLAEKGGYKAVSDWLSSRGLTDAGALTY